MIGFVHVLQRSTVDVVSIFLAFFVVNDSVSALFCAKVSAVSVDGVPFVGQLLRRNLYIMDIGGGYFNVVDNPSILVYANVSRVPEESIIPLLGGMYMVTRIPCSSRILNTETQYLPVDSMQTSRQLLM